VEEQGKRQTDLSPYKLPDGQKPYGKDDSSKEEMERRMTG
jgi:hypothetical protein